MYANMKHLRIKQTISLVLLFLLAAALADATGQRAVCKLNVTEAPALYKDAVDAVILELSNSGEKPGDFYVQFPEKPPAGTIVVLNLWHVSAFRKKQRGIPGNPGGRCRDIHYDTRQKKIVKVLFWQ